VNWLAIFIVYYILLFLGLGGIAVDIFHVTDWEAMFLMWLGCDWEAMFLMWLGCCIGHYFGKIDAGGLPVGRSGSRKA
jgi:hypothetical protein